MEILTNWKLNPDKLVATTTDNGSNVVVAFEILQVMHISYFGHNLDLCVKKGFS